MQIDTVYEKKHPGTPGDGPFVTVPGCRLFPLEMEDLTMSVEAGLETSIEALKATISR